MLIVKKSLNSSIVLVEQNGHEVILFGKGIGYGKKPGEKIKSDDVSQVFMPVDNLFTKQLIDSIDSIDEVYFELTQQIVQFAQSRLGQKLNQTIYLALSDHLSFAVERHKNGIAISNRVFWEIKNFYPLEFSIGMYALERLEHDLGYKLPEQEAANIAFHLINAQREGEEPDANGIKCAQLIGKVVNIVRHTVGNRMPLDGVHYSRFITHVKFFAERFFSDAMLKDDDPLFEHLRVQYPQAMDGAFKIKEYIDQAYSKSVSNEELTYLAVHIHRLLNTTANKHEYVSSRAKS